MNYSELVTAIEDTTENRDPTFVTNIPVFVGNAEKRIFNAVRVPAFRKTAQAAFTANTATVTVPSDFVSAEAIATISSGAYGYLLQKEKSFLREAYPNPTTTGTPRYYAQLSDTEIIVAPTPASAIGYEMTYFYYPPSIVDAGTSWLGDKFPFLLLSAALVDAGVFMKVEEDMMKTYNEQFAVNLKLLSEFAKKDNSAGTYR